MTGIPMTHPSEVANIHRPKGTARLDLGSAKTSLMAFTIV
jgi:hypothetical protein